MNKEKAVTMKQMKEALAAKVGSKFPLKITLGDGEVMVQYIRGFAGQQSNTVLVSQNNYTLVLRSIEIKDIRTIEYGEESTGGEGKILHAKWLNRDQ